ncbi:non-ribosomal peptide synthetase, partial [Acrocarpospora phusangensis]|uniref:non-ribosomal peptide synthetase n=1 Tax=Acrocarpospora phusangensis TaxID=1070424 RepID=UPI001951F4CD
MSLAQERLWFLHRLDPRDPSYHLFHVARLIGPVDPDRLAAALTQILTRHEVLRSRFPLRDGSPVQVVDPPEPFALELIFAAEPDELVTARISQPFDLAAERLIRATLITSAPERFTLCLVVHHIVADAWSLGLLRQELALLYGGQEPPPLPAQYADYLLEADTGAPKSLDYWTDILVDAPPLNLPADRPRPPVATTSGGHVQRSLPESLLQAVDRFSAVERCTPFMVLMAAYQALLAGRSGGTDISVGFATAGRRKVEYEPLIGLFANTLVLRGDLSGDPTFRQILRQTRSRLLAAYRHLDVPFDQLLTALDVARDQSRTPLFQAMFGLFNLANPTLTLPGVTTEHVEPDFPHATHELRFAVYEKGMLAVYNTDLFDRETIQRYVAGYHDILERVIREPEIRLSRLTAPRGDELDLVLHGWNQTAPGVSGTFDAMFAAQVAARPDALALICGEDRLTYAELDRRVTDLSARIPAGRGDLVAVQLPRSTDLLVALLAVQRTGAAYVPLDPDYPPARLAFVLADSGAKPLFPPPPDPDSPDAGAIQDPDSPRDPGAALNPRATQDPNSAREFGAARTPSATQDLNFARDIGAARNPSAIQDLNFAWDIGAARNPSPAQEPQAAAGVAGASPKFRPSAGDAAYVLYTSGSTGRPKGVTVPHSALTNLLAAMADQLGSGAGDVWLAATSLAFDISALELYLPLVTGGTVVLAESTEAPALARLIRAEGVTHVQATPSGWRALLDAGFHGPGLVALAGGEALPASLARELRPRVGRLVNVYGPTETTIWSTSWEVPDNPDEIRIGSPIGGTRCYIVDEHLDPLPIGVPGELLIGGSGVALGYLGRPSLTAD